LLAIGAYVAVVAVTAADNSARLVRDAVRLISVIVAVRLCLWSSRILPPLRLGKFVAWGAIFALTHLGALYFLALIQSVSPSPAMLATVVEMGALTGFGAGIGYELSALVAEGARSP
jgi:hypothetical protein